MGIKLLRLKQIIGTPEEPGMIPVSASTWWAGVKSGRFPQPVKLGPRTTAWIESEIEALSEKMGDDASPVAAGDIRKTTEDLPACEHLDVSFRFNPRDFSRPTFWVDPKNKQLKEVVERMLSALTRADEEEK